MLCLCSHEEEERHLHTFHIWFCDTEFHTVKYSKTLLVIGVWSYSMPGEPFSLSEKYTQNSCSCNTFGLSFISRTAIALQGVIFHWLTYSLTLLFITTDYNCEQAFRAEAGLRGWGRWGTDSDTDDKADLLSPKTLVWLFWGARKLNSK